MSRASFWTGICATGLIAVGASFWLCQHDAGGAREPLAQPPHADSTDRHFLVSGRAPTVTEAFSSIPIEYCLQSNERNDIVVFGESACRAGVDSRRLEELTGLPTFNLGSIGSLGPGGQVITAKAYFSKHPPPKIVVLCVLPVSFEIPTDEPVTARFERIYGPAADGPTITPMSATTNDVRELPIHGWEVTTYFNLQKDLTRGRGFLALPAKRPERMPLPRAGQTVIIRDDWDKGVRAIAQVCAGHGLKLIVRFLPLSTDVKNTENFAPLEAWAAKLRRDCPNVTICRPLLLWYEPRLMWDRIHPAAAGAREFTALVAKDVQAALGK
jgi:hypothetical protein